LDALTQKILRQSQPRSSLRIAGEVMAGMRTYHWPGNLRQLHTVLRTASAMMGPDEQEISWAHLPDDLLEELQPAQLAAHATAPVIRLAQLTTPAPAPAPSAPKSLQQLSQVLVQQALDSCKGNVSQAARKLGISRQTLYKKMKQL
jgi:transcriptional regulator of acetoin/glycerol metabolism